VSIAIRFSSIGRLLGWLFDSPTLASKAAGPSTPTAREIGVPTNRITAIMAGTRAITAETALKLAARFGTSAEFWMNLQTANDLAMARQALAAA
jgi:addiction module HigA family antidote